MSFTEKKYNRLNISKFFKNDERKLDLMYKTFENDYLSPIELVEMLYYDYVNRNELIDNMLKYKIKTTNLGIYVLGVYENWHTDYKKLDKHILGETYAIIDDLGTEHYMYGTFREYERIKNLFEKNNLLLVVGNIKNLGVHDNPIFDKNNNVSKSMVFIFNGDIIDFWRNYH